MSKCISCGADIKKDDVKCPYCGTMQYDAAEKQYMDKLYTLEEGMDKFDDDAKVYVFRDTAKSVLITLAAAAVAVFIGVLLGYAQYHQNYDSSAADEQAMAVMDWYDDNIDYIETCYRRRDFAAIRAKLNENNALVSHRSLKNWEHYPLCIIYSDTYFGFEKLQEGSSKSFTEYEFTDKYRAAVSVIGIKMIESSSSAKNYAQCTEYDKTIVNGWIDEATAFMENALGLTRNQYESDVNEIYNGNNYIEYTNVQEYAKKYYQIYTSNLNGGAQ